MSRFAKYDLKLSDVNWRPLSETSCVKASLAKDGVQPMHDGCGRYVGACVQEDVF